MLISIMDFGNFFTSLLEILRFSNEELLKNDIISIYWVSYELLYLKKSSFLAINLLFGGWLSSIYMLGAHVIQIVKNSIQNIHFIIVFKSSKILTKIC